jgi:hypothetical protein
MSRTPEPQDRVYDYRRRAAGKRPDGFMYDVDEDTGQYTVVYPTRRIQYEGQCVRIDGILHHCHVLLWHPEYLYGGDELVDYYYGEIEWSSSDGGREQWVVA